MDYVDQVGGLTRYDAVGDWQPIWRECPAGNKGRQEPMTVQTISVF